MKLEQIKREALETGIKDFYNYVRNYYLQENGFEVVEIPGRKKKVLDKLVSEASLSLNVMKKYMWESEKFHMAFRITSLDELVSLDEDIDVDNVKLSLDEGRKLSILPLNVLLGKNTMKKFVPDLPKLYSGEQEHSLDPYGIFRGKDQIRAEKDGKSIYLGSRKFDYAVLLNITEFCPVGCSECYKGTLTRLSEAALADLEPKYAELKKQLNLQEQRAIEQTRLLKKWLNKHPEVDTVIISGGEPLMYSPDTIGEILDQLGEAEHLKVIRICTSAVYQGLFYKFEDDPSYRPSTPIIDVMNVFRGENDGRNKPKKQLYLNCNVTDEHQLLTPEAKIVTEKLQDAGISIHLQMPLQEGINFYRNDSVKSSEKLKKICKAAYEIGAIPYKAIVNMHSPSYEELTVPIEKVSETISFLDEHFEESDMQRWQAYNILHEQGNAYIYAKPNFTAEKDIDRKRGRVTYYIPKIKHEEIIIHTYEEPLIEGINDENSLRIDDEKILSRINEVRSAYKKLRNDEIDTRKFYQISGIKFSENEPLIIEK